MISLENSVFNLIRTNPADRRGERWQLLAIDIATVKSREDLVVAFVRGDLSFRTPHRNNSNAASFIAKTTDAIVDAPGDRVNCILTIDSCERDRGY